jgi:hypothetical protein
LLPVCHPRADKKAVKGGKAPNHTITLKCSKAAMRSCVLAIWTTLVVLLSISLNAQPVSNGTATIGNSSSVIINQQNQNLAASSSDDVEQTIYPLSINASSLSMTSFSFNTLASMPSWVDRIMGSRSVYHTKNNGSILTNKPLQDHEVCHVCLICMPPDSFIS